MLKKKIFCALGFVLGVGLSLMVIKASVYTTDKGRINFLKENGWEAKTKPIEVSDVTIPDKNEAVYKEYNKIQKRQGMNLDDYCGKTVKRYTYEITNHEYSMGRQVRANILVFKGKIIGGDIMVTALDGFMHALTEHPKF